MIATIHPIKEAFTQQLKNDADIFFTLMIDFDGNDKSHYFVWFGHKELAKLTEFSIASLMFDSLQ